MVKLFLQGIELVAKGCDVLNLEWLSFPSRDRDVATLVCNYLRLNRFEVREHSSFEAFSLIDKLKPKVLFMTNTTGASINVQIVKYAKERGCKCVSLISEGNFRPGLDNYDNYVWGWNKEKIMYEDETIYWTERTKDIAIKENPDLEKIIKVSGAIGYDVYKVRHKISKKELLTKYGKQNFKKVIGVGLWDFNFLYPHDHRFADAEKAWSVEVINRFRDDHVNFNKIFLQVIEKNPDTLFILKMHPASQGGEKYSGIEGCSDFENTLIIKREEPIFNCLAVSDIWAVYDSTTASEAWLMETPTCLINPSGIDFPRENIHKGSPYFSTSDEFCNAIYEFYETGELRGFKEKEQQRIEILEEVSEWSDGFNHVRAGNRILEYLESIEDKKLLPESIENRKLRYKYWFKLKFISLFKKISPGRYGALYDDIKRFNNKDIEEIIKERMIEQKSFYKKKNLTLSDLKKIECL